MKKYYVIALSIFTFSLVFTSFVNGPANRGHDKTGSPNSNGSCMNCHSSNSFEPSLLINMFDGETEVNSFDPGKKYTLRYQVINTGSPAAFGFQTVALTANNKNAGAFSDVPNGFQEISLNDASYVEHSSPSPVSSFEVSWTSPDNADEEVTIYGGAVAANGNSNTGGDGGSTNSLTLTPNTSSVLTQDSKQSELFHLRSNLVQDEIAIQTFENSYALNIIIYNQNGQVIKRQLTENGNFESTINVSDLQNGIYYLRAESKTAQKVEKFLKI